MLSYALQRLEEEAHYTDQGKPHAACSYRWVDVSSNLLESTPMEDTNMEDSSLKSCCRRPRSNDTCVPFLCQYAVKIHIGNTDSDHCCDDDEHDVDPSTVSDRAIRWAVLYK
jgi:hypothetical protein